MTTSDAQAAERIRENLATVREKIAAAAARTGRNASQVRLIGVTKYVEPPLAQMLFEAGLTDLGESRPQELWRKSTALTALPVTWHLIGHLQRNKTKRTLQAAAWIHSGDSLRLLEEIDCESGPVIHPVLLEVNISRDATKHGFHPDEIELFLPELIKLQNIDICGLMTMAALEGGPDQIGRAHV